MGEHAHCSGCIRGRRCVDAGPCPVRSCPNACGAWMHACKLDDHTAEVCDLAEMRCPNAMYGCPSTLRRRLLGLHLASCPANLVRCRMASMRPAGPDERAEGATMAHGRFARVHTCGQVVRRDAFPAHALEHSETQPSLDGWFEARCPLAQLGCPFVFRRFRPRQAATVVRYSAEMQALVATSEAEPPPPAPELCHLLRLPMEVLVRILSLLDGLSLSSLARTCLTLREACSVLLRSKGCVSRQWRPVGGGKWELNDTLHWTFNRSMDPVREWRMTDEGLSAVQRHLLDCSFNRREPMRAEPLHVMLTTAESG